MPPEWRQRVDIGQTAGNKSSSVIGNKPDYDHTELKDRGYYPSTSYKDESYRSRRRSPEYRQQDSMTKVCSSDSEEVGGEELMGDGDVRNRLLRPGNKTNSLPRMDSGRIGTKDELKHWLKKLDKLSLELQDFNNSASTSRDKGT